MKSRRCLFAVVDGGGNVPPELGAARRLVERGHSVTVLAEDSVASDVCAAGAALRWWVHAPNRPDRRPEHDPARDWECKSPWQLVDRLMTTTQLQARSERIEDAEHSEVLRVHRDVLREFDPATSGLDVDKWSL